ncbi:MAG: hypothetical protein ABIX37_07005, partial [Gammaproteobacteria bacterium]
MTQTLLATDLLAEGGTVVTATHRLARQVRLRHDRSRAAAGRRAWPTADVLPLDAWLRRTWESSNLRESAPDHLRLLSEDESRLVWRRVLASDGQDRLDAGVIVSLVASGWRLCQAWGIPASALHAADSEDGRMFAQWVDSYVAELERRGWQDAGGLLQALGHAARGIQAGARRIGFAGFDPWTPALAQLADRLQADGHEVTRLLPSRRSGTRRIVAVRNESDELARAFSWAAGHAGPGADAPPAIVIPDLERQGEGARRLGLDILAPGWRLREPAVRPVVLAAGRQLADYPVVHCALNVLDVLVADASFEQASLLLRSCYLAGADEERGGRARAELQLRRTPLEHIGPRFLATLLDRQALVMAARWRAADTLVEPLRGRRLLPSAWAGQFAAWLAAAGWPGDRVLASEEFQAAEAWQRALEAFAGTDEVAGPLPLGTAVGILAQQARDKPFEPESHDEAVQVLSFREAEGQEFGALWLCGLTADRWPGPARPHALIPLALQQAAGMPEATPAATEEQTRRRFEQLLASTEHLVLSWPVEQGDAETLPSPLLTSPLVADAYVVMATADEITLHPDRQCVA